MLNTVLQGFRICHPKTQQFGILIILNERDLRNSLCKDTLNHLRLEGDEGRYHMKGTLSETRRQKASLSPETGNLGERALYINLANH